MRHFRLCTPQYAQFEYDENTERIQAMSALLDTILNFYLSLVTAKGKSLDLITGNPTTRR